MKNNILKSITILAAFLFILTAAALIIPCMTLLEISMKTVVIFVVSGLWLALFLLANSMD